MKTVFAVLIAVLLSACGSFGGLGSMGGMSAEQISAATKDKSSAAACFDFTGAGGRMQTMVINNDKTFGSAGGTTTLECGGAKVTFQDAGKAGSVPAAAPKP